MALGEYRPPNQIAKDEDKYWKLTKPQLVYVGIGLFVGFGIFSLLAATNITFLKILGVVLTLVCAIGGGFIGGFTIPNVKYLKGGGLRLDRYLLKKVEKRFNKRKRLLYTRNIDRDNQVIPYVSITEKESERRDKPKVPSLLETFKEMFGGMS